MAKVTVINQEREPLMLEDGTQVGAAYTPEASRTVELSDGDRKKYVLTGRLAVMEVTAEKVVVDIPAAPVPLPAPAKAAAPEPTPAAEPGGKSERRPK